MIRAVTQATTWPTTLSGATMPERRNDHKDAPPTCDCPIGYDDETCPKLAVWLLDGNNLCNDHYHFGMRMDGGWAVIPEGKRIDDA